MRRLFPDILENFQAKVGVMLNKNTVCCLLFLRGFSHIHAYRIVTFKLLASERYFNRSLYWRIQNNHWSWLYVQENCIWGQSAGTRFLGSTRSTNNKKWDHFQLLSRLIWHYDLLQPLRSNECEIFFSQKVQKAVELIWLLLTPRMKLFAGETSWSGISVSPLLI